MGAGLLRHETSPRRAHTKRVDVDALNEDLEHCVEQIASDVIRLQ